MVEFIALPFLFPSKLKILSFHVVVMQWLQGLKKRDGGGGVLPYMGFIDMCRCEEYGFQAVYSGIGYINQRVWV